MASNTYWVTWRTHDGKPPTFHADPPEDGAKTLCGIAIPYGRVDVSMTTASPGKQACKRCLAAVKARD